MNKTILVILLVALVLGAALAVVSLPTVSAISSTGGSVTSCGADPAQMRNNEEWKDRCIHG